VFNATFQLYHGSQFYWWRKQDYTEKTTNLLQVTDKLHVHGKRLSVMQGSRWASPMSPFAIFDFIWRQNTTLGDFFGDNILFIKNCFVLLSINGAGKKIAKGRILSPNEIKNRKWRHWRSPTRSLHD
jgi:hypothetical protein